MSQKQDAVRYNLMLLLVAIIWGTGFIATQIAIDYEFSSSFIMLVRFSLAAIIFGVVFRKDVAGIKKQDWLGGLSCGTLLFGGFILQTVGLQSSSPSTNAFLTATNIVLVPFLSWFLFRDRPPIKAFIGALLCFAGVWVLSYEPGAGGASFGKGEVFTLLGAICFAGHTTSLGYFARKAETRCLNFMQLLVAAVLSLALFLIADRDIGQFIPTRGHFAVLYLAVFSTCIAYFIQTTAQKHVEPSKVAVIISTESLFASLLSVVLGFELMRATLVIGGILILASVLVVELNFKAEETQT